MTSKEKQSYNRQKYINNLKNYREAYEERKEFLKGWSLPTYKKKVLNSSSDTENIGEASGEVTGGVANVNLNGKLPTVDQYQGPDDYVHPEWGKYQTGLRARIAGTDKWNEQIMAIAAKTQCNPLLIKITMALESSGNHSTKPNAYGCVGLMQIKLSEYPNEASKIINDPLYNIEKGARHLLIKYNESKGVIKRALDRFSDYKARGHVLTENIRGTMWMYNGFNIPAVTTQSNKSENGKMYGDQAAAMYAGFGRDPDKDTAITMDVLGSNSNTNGSHKNSADDKGKEAKSGLKIEDDFIPIEGPFMADMTEEGKEQMKNFYNIKHGLVTGSSFQAPDYDRFSYIDRRLETEEYLSKESYRPLPSDQFIHLGGPVENLYPKDAHQAFRLLLQRLGCNQLKVVRGFDVRNSETSHAIGIAMDIYAETPEEAIFIADTAFNIGFRAIAIGPKFVHVDTGPACTWRYDELPAYRGPGTVKVSDLQNGYR